MSRVTLGLAALTVLDCDPLAQIDLAERHGFDAIGVRLTPASPGTPAYPLHEERARLDAVRHRLEDSPIEVLDVEILRLTPDFNLTSVRTFLEASQLLGARAVLVAGNDAHRTRLTDNYALLAQACAEYGLVAALEPMPWTQVKNVREALEVVALADGAAAMARSVLVDTLHVARSETTLEDIAAIPAEWIHYAQLSDGSVPAPRDEGELIRQAREERQVPGEGGIGVAGILAALPLNTPISVELPNEQLRRAAGTGPWLDRLAAAARSVIDSCGKTPGA